MNADQVRELRELGEGWVVDDYWYGHRLVALCDDWLRAQEVVEAARPAVRKLAVEYRRGLKGSFSRDESWAEGELLADALAAYDAGGEG